MFSWPGKCFLPMEHIITCHENIPIDLKILFHTVKNVFCQLGNIIACHKNIPIHPGILSMVEECFHPLINVLMAWEVFSTNWEILLQVMKTFPYIQEYYLATEEYSHLLKNISKMFLRYKGIFCRSVTFSQGRKIIPPSMKTFPYSGKYFHQQREHFTWYKNIYMD